MNVRTAVVWWGLALAVGALLMSPPRTIRADDEPQAEQPAPQQGAKAPLARFITVTSPVDDVMFGRVTNVALALQNQAVQENRRAILVLEITPGASQFHQVQGLARFLTSARLANVTTVAWIPETVTGNNVVLALAANEILLHPDAELGDIGRGRPMDKDEQQSVLSLVEKRHNPQLSRALALGMMDPQQVVLKVTVQQRPDDPETTETRVVTPEELRRLRDNRAVIQQVETIKEGGVVGTFSGSQARALNILAVQSVSNRAEIAELYNLPREALREDPSSGSRPKVSLIRIDSVIEPVLEAFVERQIERAVANGTNLLIFEIDSPGGLLLQSRNLAYAIADLDPKEVRTVAYVPDEALSGAAIIALGCDEIYMHPHARLGDAGPIEVREGQQFERAPEKVLSVLRQILNELAERKNRPPALAMAMADKDLKVYQVTHRETGRIWYMTEEEIHRSDGDWIQGRVVPESAENLLLTVNGERAHELRLAEPPVADIDELKTRLGIPLDMALPAVGRTWVDTLIFVLNTRGALFLLVVIGVVCLYLELHLMTGLLGIISALCFSLFFWSRFLGGTAGWLEVVLFVLGLVCIAIEVFVLPGFGVFGLSGGLMVIASLVLASQTFGNWERNADLMMLSRTVGTLSASIVSIIILAVLMNRFLPKLPLLNQMILTPPGMIEVQDPKEPRLKPEFEEAEAQRTTQSLVGQEGVSVSMLRPAGKAQIGDQYFDVVSDGPYINAGAPIQVVSVSGNRIVVREIV